MSNGVVFRANVGVASYEYGLTGSGAMLRAVVNCAGDPGGRSQSLRRDSSSGQCAACSNQPVPRNRF